VKIVRSVVFDGDAVEVQYMDESDVRLEGNVFITHQATIMRGADHDDEIDAVENAAMDLLVDVLGDFARSLPFDASTMVEDDEDDDD
jgi:hypothetical protein